MEKESGRVKRGSGAGWGSVLRSAMLASLLLAVPVVSHAASVMLQWDPSVDTALAGYRLYYQADSSLQPFSGGGAAEGSAPLDVAGSTVATVSGLDPGSNYYFAVTAYNTSGVESVYSNVVEVKETVAPVVNVLSPAPLSSVKGVVNCTATASDNKGVTSVEFYVDGTLKGSDATAPYAYDWDTSSLAGGTHTLVAKAYDAAGNVGSSELTVTVAGDTTAPIVTVNAPADGATVAGTVAVTVVATDDTGVLKVELYDNGALVFASNEVPASYSWNTLAAGNGSHILTARALDPAGNAGAATVKTTVLNDLFPPTVSISTPGNGATVGGVVGITATATDDIGVVGVDFYLNGVLSGSDSSAPYQLQWNTASFANGAHTVVARAYDAAGRAGESAAVTVQVFNDTLAPTVSVTSPATGSTVAGTVLVTANANDNVAVAKVEFYRNGVLVATDAGAPYSYSWNTLAGANDSYTLFARAFDAAGNTAQSASVSVRVYNDVAAPSVSITSPATGATADASATITVAATDDVAVTRVDLYLNGALLATSNSGTLSFNWNTSALANGSYLLTARAYDAAGNVGASQGVAVTVQHPQGDTVAPVVTITAPAARVSTNWVKVAATATDNVAVTRMEVFLDGTLKGVTSSGTINVPVKLSSGTHTVTVKAYDAARNVAVASRTVTR